tara:strand:+ start:113 stop:928 length:816 start_codon:yes stop_codon:yes gene_type:complete
MLKKKILVIISGKLNFFSKKNFYKIKDSFKDYDLEFCLFPWQGQSAEVKKKFLDIYKPIHFEEIETYDFEKEVKLIKFPDYAGNPIGTLNMYRSICVSFNIVDKMYFKKLNKPDYVLRFRSDILPKDNQKFINKAQIEKSILVPDRYHWNGLNDQIFLINFKDLKVFENFNNFLKKHIEENRFFSSEYIFLRFIKKYFKINYTNFDYNIMRFKNNFKKFKNIESKKLLIDQINCKINKFKFKIRNFKDHYIKKINRNKFQEIFIDLDNNAS